MAFGFAFRVAVGAAVASMLFGYLRRRNQKAGPRRAGEGGERAYEERHPSRSAGPIGRSEGDALADEASADSFPASDPPSHMNSFRLGGPGR